MKAGCAVPRGEPDRPPAGRRGPLPAHPRDGEGREKAGGYTGQTPYRTKCTGRGFRQFLSKKAPDERTRPALIAFCEPKEKEKASGSLRARGITDKKITKSGRNRRGIRCQRRPCRRRTDRLSCIWPCRSRVRRWGWRRCRFHPPRWQHRNPAK